MERVVHPKEIIYWKMYCIHSQAIQDDFSLTEKIWINLALLLAHLWILCSEWVPSEWESKQLIKTSQSSTTNPHDSNTSINILWSEKLHVYNNIHADIFDFKRVLYALYCLLKPKYCLHECYYKHAAFHFIHFYFCVNYSFNVHCTYDVLFTFVH